MIKLRLTNAQVVLITRGARVFQHNPAAKLDHNDIHCIESGFPLLTYTGAKLRKLGGGWWNLCGYGYEVVSRMPRQFPILRVDELDTLRMLGYAT